jgi:hypothetical protein
MSINVCELCYVMEVPACQSSYSIDIGLSHTIFRWMFLEDENGNLFVQKGKTLSTGNNPWVLDTTDYPEGMFTAHSGSYTLTWSNSNDLSDQIDLSIDSGTYPCVILKFKDIDQLVDMV